jgi:hypothetical protein
MQITQIAGSDSQGCDDYDKDRAQDHAGRQAARVEYQFIFSSLHKFNPDLFNLQLARRRERLIATGFSHRCDRRNDEK